MPFNQIGKLTPNPVALGSTHVTVKPTSQGWDFYIPRTTKMNPQRNDMNVRKNKEEQGQSCRFDTSKVPRRLSLSDIKYTTMEFNRDRLVGEGASAKVYKGYLHLEETWQSRDLREI
ncbi:hypothetical protein glysoja_022208 [Glycine soja]|nr:hypothetical protein glysoja_022208 [Glycine soja]